MWDLIVSVPDHCLSFYFLLVIAENWKKSEGYNCFFVVSCVLESK